MHPLVVKYGGTSVGSVEAIGNAARLVAQEIGRWDGLVVVVSAMSGVTNLLLSIARQAAQTGELDTLLRLAELRTRHMAVLVGLGLYEQAELLKSLEVHWEELRGVCAEIRKEGEASLQRLDEVASMGERVNARIFAAVLGELGIKAQAVDATCLIVTTERLENGACPLQPLSDERIRAGLLPLLAAGVIPVVTGFIGATPEGQITTLGRGASDYTSTLVGAALDAAEVWNWTDVNGVMTGDPRLVPDAQLITALTYDEMRWLSAFGARVLHPETVSPLAQRNIPLRVRNTFRPAAPGSRVQGRGFSPGGGGLAVTCLPYRAGQGLVEGEWLRAALLPAGWRALQEAPGCELVTVIGGETRPWELARALSELPFRLLAVARNLPGESFGLLLPAAGFASGRVSIAAGQVMRWLHARLVLARSGARLFYDLSTNSIAVSSSAL